MLKMGIILNILFAGTCLASSLTYELESVDYKQEVGNIKDDESKVFEKVQMKLGKTTSRENKAIELEGKLRFYVNNKKQRQLKKQLKNNQLKRLNFMAKALELEKKSSYLKSIVSLKFIEKEERSLKNMSSSLKDKINILKILHRKGQTKLEDLIKTERRHLDVINQITNLNAEKSAFLTSISSSGAKAFPSLSRVELLEIGLIKKKIEKINILATQGDMELEKSELEYQLTKEDDNKVIEYFELSAKPTEFSVNITINLPDFRNNSKSREKLIENVKSKYDALYLKRHAQANRTKNKSKLLGKISLYENFVSLKYNNKSKRYLRIYKKTKGISPLKILNLKLTISETELEQLRSKKEIYREYIDFLAGRGIPAKEVKKELIKS